MPRAVVGEIFLNVLPQDAGVGPGVQRIINQAQANAAKVPVSADTRQAEEAVARLSGSIQDGIGGAWARAAIQAAGFTAAVLGVQRVVEGTLSKFSGLFDQLAQAQAGFTAILGSQTAGGQLLDDIREFARVSPFVTQQLVNYSQQLLGVGQSAASIVPLLKSTGDLIASVGGDTQNISRVLFTLTQIRSIGRLVGQDAIQLQSALVPITKLLADFLGKTTQEVKKLQEQGAISADTVFAAITAAGGKVEGAMATATRNIGGARAVLSDTITILFQDSEDLRRIFDDIVAGILGFSEALSTDEVQQTIARVTEGIGTLYDALQPVLAGLSGAAGTGAISFLNIFASALDALGTVVNAVPEAGLQAIGVALAAIAALKAPLYILSYIKSLSSLAGLVTTGGITRGVGALTGALSAQEKQAALTETRIDRLNSKYTVLRNRAGLAATGLAAAGLIGGTALSGSDNSATSALGGALTGASLGGAVTGFNPFGIAAGAGVGLITSLISNASRAAEERSKELETIGNRMANQIVQGFLTSSPNAFGSQRSIDRFIGEGGALAGLEDDISATQSRLIALTQELNKARATENETRIAISDSLAPDFDPVKAQARQDQLTAFFDTLNSKIDTEREKLATSKAALDSIFTEDNEFSAFLTDAALKLGELNKLQPIDTNLFKTDLSGLRDFEIFRTAATDVEALALATGQKIPQSQLELEAWEAALAELGLTAEQVANSTVPELVVAVSANAVPAFKAAREEVEKTRVALDEAKKGMTEFFAPFKTDIELIKGAAEQSAKFTSSFEALTTGTRTQAEGLAFATEILAAAQNTAISTQAAGFDAAVGLEAGASFLAGAFQELQLELELTDEKFKAFLQSVGLWELFRSSANSESNFVGTIVQLSEETGISTEKLRELLNLSAELDNKEVKLVVTAETQAAVTQLAILEGSLDGMSADGVDRATARVAVLEERLRFLSTTIRGLDAGAEGGGLGLTRAEIDALIHQASGRRDIEGTDPSSINRTFTQQRREAEAAAAAAAEKARLEAERLAEEQRREAEARAREAEALAQTIRNAGDTLTGAIQNAADAIKNAADSWTSSIKERTQFERGLSASRLITNTGRQVADLEELDAGIRTLIQRGLSEDAIGATGIDNVADLRQVRRLLQASPADLAALSSLVARRDDASERIAERAAQEQTKNTMVTAIVEAARILGFEINQETAIALSAQFSVNSDTDAAQFGQQILDFLLNSGQIARS